MKLKALVCFLLSAFVLAKPSYAYFQGFDKPAYYKIIKDGSVDDIDKEIALIDASSISEKEAYKGTLLMKKAGLVKKPKDKLAFFKEGRIKLETVIHDNESNTEYRFLRLIIQEHAPKITKYRAQVDEDKEYIKKNFSSLPPVVQDVVKDYSKTSAILHPGDF